MLSNIKPKNDEKILERYLLVALSFFMVPMQGSLLDNSHHQYDDLVGQFSQYAFKQNYNSLAKTLAIFNKNSLDFGKAYSHNKVVIDDDNIYDTALEDILEKIGDNAFDLNILRLLFYYGAKLESLSTVLGTKEENFVKKIFKITRERKGVKANVNYCDVALLQFFTNACCSKQYAYYSLPESAIRDIVGTIDVEIDVEKEAEKIGGKLPNFLINLVFNRKQATALVFILNGFNVYKQQAIKDNFSEKNIEINTDLLPLTAEKVIKGYIRKYIQPSSSSWIKIKNVFLHMIYQSLLHREIYNKLTNYSTVSKKEEDNRSIVISHQ